MVSPFMIPGEHPLHSVNDVFNAVFVHGNMLGSSMYYGRGAGKLPTASAVVSDVVDCARHQGKTIMCFWDEEKVELTDHASLVRKFFVRAKESELSVAEAEKTFGSLEVVRLEDAEGEYGFVTAPMCEKDFEENRKKVTGILSRIRLED